MPLSLTPPTALEYFATLVRNEAEIPLLEAAASLAQDAYPDLDVEQVLDTMDRLQDRLHRRVPADASPLHRLRLLNHFFYGEMGFGPNLNDFGDPDNSYLHVVLETRRGLPISLAVLWLELAQGIGLKVGGIGFPGHFLVKVMLSEGQVVLDPLTGQSFGREDLLERLEPIRQAAGLVGDESVPLSLFLQTATPWAILVRMLNNLQAVYQDPTEARRLLPVLGRQMLLQPQSWSLWRERGLAHAHCGEVALAAADLAHYLAHAPDASDRAEVQARLDRLRLPPG